MTPEGELFGEIFEITFRARPGSAMDFPATKDKEIIITLCLTLGKRNRMW